MTSSHRPRRRSTATWAASGSAPVPWPFCASVLYSVGLWQGQIVAGGADGSTSPPSTLIIRTSLAGALDAGFGAGGIYSSNDGCRANGVTVQPSGYLAVAGQDIGSSRGFCAARATSAGALAWHIGSFSGDYSSYTGVASTADDKVVLVGRGQAGEGGSPAPQRRLRHVIRPRRSRHVRGRCPAGQLLVLVLRVGAAGRWQDRRRWKQEQRGRHAGAPLAVTHMWS